MITPEMIARINELARKQKVQTLTAEEKAEQAELRRLYIDNIKGQVKNQLDNITIVDADDHHHHHHHENCGCKHKH